jgi:hypothetical protein
VKIYPEAKTTSAFYQLLLEQGPKVVLLWNHDEKINRVLSLTKFLISEGIETEEQLRNWISNDHNKQRILSVRGVGPKTADYIQILIGMQNVAVDRYSRGILQEAGVSWTNYGDAHKIISLAADILGFEITVLDNTIWEYMSKRDKQKSLKIFCNKSIKSAKDFAKNKPLELIDGPKLTKLLDEYLGEKTEKGTEKIRIPKAYIATVDLLIPAIKKSEERRTKIRTGLLFVDRKHFKDDQSFLHFIGSKFSTLGSLFETMNNQINHLMVLWENSMGEDENYINISKIKQHCKEIVSTMNRIEKDWEKIYAIELPLTSKKLHEMACKCYEAIFREYDKFVLSLEKIIKSPEDYISGDNKSASIMVNYHNVSKHAEELTKEIESLNRKSVQKGGCCVLFALSLIVSIILFILIVVA